MDANYTISYVPGTLAVSPADLTVIAADAARAYGQTNPIFTVTYAGFVNGETNTALDGTLVLQTTADTGSPVGTYPITPSGLSSTNYALVFRPGTLTITAPAPVLLSLTGMGTPSVVITWSAVSNATYRVQYKTDLNAPTWTDLDGDVLASGNLASKTDLNTPTNRFYRVGVSP